MQLSINCRIRHCLVCCPVPWAAKHSSRAREARRDWLQQLRLMYSIMLMTLQVGRPAISFYFILFYYKRASGLTIVTYGEKVAS